MPAADSTAQRSSPAPSALDAARSVNETIRRWPSSIAVLGAFGIDTCCGGSASLDAAARDVGVPTETLLDAIARAIADAERGA